MTEPLDIEPILPHESKAPKRYESETAEAHAHQSPKDMYRKYYFEVIDLAACCIQNPFQQAGYEVYKHLEELLLKASQDMDFSPLSHHFKERICKKRLCMPSCLHLLLKSRDSFLLKLI